MFDKKSILSFLSYWSFKVSFSRNVAKCPDLKNKSPDGLSDDNIMSLIKLRSCGFNTVINLALSLS